MDYLDHFSFVEESSRFDKQHATRTAELTYQIAVKSNHSIRTAEKYKDAAFWHDCGKLFLPQNLLNKPGTLTDEEFELIRSHTHLGFDYIEDSNMPNGKLRADVALYHHERLNGSGYIGLRGKAICKAARIVAIADAFDAMTHDRPYRNALSQQEAIKELIRQSGFLFDERYVHSLLKVLAAR
jgi:HD-GYP domain-containing protein (c-di-GMP phosphodiesterase class II)